MSILIKGIKMPECCEYCDFLEDDGCCIAMSGDEICEDAYDEIGNIKTGYVDPDCPLVEVEDAGGDTYVQIPAYHIKELPSAETKITLESAIDYLNSIDWLPEHDRIITESTKRKSTESLRKGKWIEDDDSTVRGHCSECGWESHYYEDDVIGMPFCPNCGAKMISESECWAEVGKSFAEGLYKGLTERD